MPRLRSSPRAPISHLAFAGLLLLLLGLVFATFPDYGMTTDEGVQQRYGNRLVRFYATLGADDSALWQNNLYYYGGLFELLAQGARRLSPWGMYETRHLVNALFGILGVLAAWGLGSRLAGATGGLLSALFLALTPRFYGDWFANPKDLPFASLYALAAWAILAAADTLPRLGGRQVIVTGVAIGAAAAVRVPGIVLIAWAALLWLGSLALAQGAASADRKITGRAWVRTGMALFATSALAWVVMIATWPWGLVKPFRNPLLAFQKFSNFWDVVTILYEGRPVLRRDLPRDYVLRMLTLTLPELYPLAFLLGTVGVVLLLRKRRLAAPRLFAVAWLASLAAGPLAWMIVRHTPLYNGVRHVLFLLPVLAVLAGVSVAAFVRARPGRLALAAAALALGASAVVTVVDMVQLHPYQYVYFNRSLAGGLPGAVGRYETDYWCASFKEGLEWMVREYRPASVGPIRVWGRPCAGDPLRYYLGRIDTDQRFEPDAYPPHLQLVTTTTVDQPPAHGRVLHTVLRQGAPLLRLIEVEAPPSGDTGTGPPEGGP